MGSLGAFCGLFASQVLCGGRMQGIRFRNLPVAIFCFSKPRSGVMVRRAMSILVLAGGILAASTLFAQQGQSLSQMARDAARNFRPVTREDVARAKGQLAAALARLDAFLRTGAPYKLAGWQRYLQWNDLVALTQNDQPPSPDTVNALLAKLKANQGGLERSEFTQLREALANYAAVASAAANDKAQEEYSKRMDDLAAQL